MRGFRFLSSPVYGETELFGRTGIPGSKAANVTTFQKMSTYVILVFLFTVSRIVSIKK